MPPFTVVLHTRNDARRLGRALETLLPSSDVLVVDLASRDATVRIANRYGARVVLADQNSAADRWTSLAACEWVFCIEPAESFTEGLQATLFEWSLLAADRVHSAGGFSVAVRSQTGEHWDDLTFPKTRLVPRGWRRWNGWLPAPDERSIPLEGELLRLPFP